MYAYVKHGEIELLAPIQLPGIDSTGGQGLLIHWVYHVIMIFCGASIGLVCSDLMMVLLILHSCAMADILCFKLRTMGDQLCKLERWRQPRGDPATSQFLHQCVRLHQDYVWYIGYMAENYYLIFTVEVMSNFLTLCMSLYVLMLIEWYPLYGLIVLMVVKTFYLCVLGTIVELQVCICLPEGGF